MTTFLVLLAAYTLSQFYRSFLAIVAGELTRTLGLNAADLGSVSAIWFAAFALAQFPVGWSLDRLGPRRTLAGFMAMAVLGAAWFARAGSLADCLVAMALIGIGCSPVLMASLYVFGRTYPPERFAMLASLVIGLGSVGNLLGATPLALAVEAFGWRAAMGGIAALTAAAVLLAFLALRDPPRAAGAGGASAFGGLGDIMAIRALWRLLPLVCVGYAVVIATRSLWIAPFFGEVHGFTITERGNAALIMAAAMSLGALAYGPIERAIGDPKRTTLVGTAITGLAYLALGLFGQTSAALALALVAAIGAAGLTYGILMAHARLFLPAHLLGRGVTFMNFGFIGGAGITQWLSGLFVQAGREAGAPPDLVYGHLHLAFGAVLLAAGAVYAFAPARPAEAGRRTPPP
ncbi:MAG TPA: MFS transporter [Microvirga sp.]|nr:MFS transporter [Microvirga sp.]